MSSLAVGKALYGLRVRDVSMQKLGSFGGLGWKAQARRVEGQQP
jgi:hypothetical protein